MQSIINAKQIAHIDRHGSTWGQKGFFQAHIAQSRWQVQALNGVQDQRHLKTHNDPFSNQNPREEKERKKKVPCASLEMAARAQPTSLKLLVDTRELHIC